VVAPAVDKTEVELSLQKMERLFSFALLGIALVVLFAQLRSLFYLPIFDSYLWWGDESWLMVEWKEQILHGVFRHPYALAATMHVGNGTLLNAQWLTALLYGLPQILLSAATDPVTIGRCVTAFCAILLVTSTYYILRRTKAPHLLCIFGLLLLITAKSFILTSHSARYDILTAFVLLWLFFYCSGKSKLHPILFGLLLPALLLISVHAFVLGASLWALGVYLRGYWRSTKEASLVLAGVLAGAVALYLASFIAGQTAGLLTSTNGTGFRRNMEDLPLLRPFSRSVQIANIVQRWKTIVEFAPLVLGFSVMALMLWLTGKLRNVSARTGRLSSLTIGAILILVSWLALESAAPTSYLIYILPIMIVAAIASVARVLDRTSSPAGLTIAAMILLFMISAALAALSFSETNKAATVGLALAGDNLNAVDLSIQAIQKDATEHHLNQPRVLIQTPAVNESLRLLGSEASHSFELMTTQFIEYPATNFTPEQVVRAQNVSYVMLYGSRMKPFYMREVDPLMQLVATHGVMIARAVQPMIDVGRSYFIETKNLVADTLTIYRLTP
jgi:hypothetical protein